MLSIAKSTGIRDCFLVYMFIIRKCVLIWVFATFRFCGFGFRFFVSHCFWGIPFSLDIFCLPFDSSFFCWGIGGLGCREKLVIAVTFWEMNYRKLLIIQWMVIVLNWSRFLPLADERLALLFLITLSFCGVYWCHNGFDFLFPGEVCRNLVRFGSHTRNFFGRSWDFCRHLPFN